MHSFPKANPHHVIFLCRHGTKDCDYFAMHYSPVDHMELYPALIEYTYKPYKEISTSTGDSSRG